MKHWSALLELDFIQFNGEAKIHQDIYSVSRIECDCHQLYSPVSLESYYEHHKSLHFWYLPEMAKFEP